MIHHRQHKHSMLHHTHYNAKHPVNLKEEIEELALPAEMAMRHGGMAHHHHHNPKASFPLALEKKMAKHKFQI